MTLPTAPDQARQAARYKGIVGAARRYLDLLWPRVDWTSPKAKDAVALHYQGIVTRFGDGAAAMAAEHYDNMRAEQQIPGRYRAVIAKSAPAQQITKIVNSAFLGHDTTTDEQTSAGDQTTSDLPVEQRVQTRLEDALSRLVQQPARDTIELNAKKDPAKPRWIRVPTGPTTCEFCIMLASRELGPNFTGYSSERSALFDNLGNSYHRNCDCVAMPVFPGQDAHDISPHMAEYHDIYEKAVQQAGTRRDAKKILAEMRQVLKDQQPPALDPPPTPPEPPVPTPVDLNVPKPAAHQPAH